MLDQKSNERAATISSGLRLLTFCLALDREFELCWLSMAINVGSFGQLSLNTEQNNSCNLFRKVTSKMWSGYKNAFDNLAL